MAGRKVNPKRTLAEQSTVNLCQMENSGMTNENQSVSSFTNDTDTEKPERPFCTNEAHSSKSTMNDDEEGTTVKEISRLEDANASATRKIRGNCPKRKTRSNTREQLSPKDDSRPRDTVREKTTGPRILDGITCRICNRKFQSRKSQWAHTRTHTGEKSYTCHVCGKQFVQGGSLYYHLKHVHDGVKNHSCDICGRSFAMKTAMADHRRIHTGERPYVCDSCGKTFKTKASLYIHGRTHTDEFPHECTFCDKRFRWRQQMLSHLTVHTGEKNHTCDICGRGFGVKNDLTRHRRVHSGEKPYTCQRCGISFGQKRYLKSHERLRLGTCGYSPNSSRADTPISSGVE